MKKQEEVIMSKELSTVEKKREIKQWSASVAAELHDATMAKIFKNTDRLMDQHKSMLDQHKSMIEIVGVLAKDVKELTERVAKIEESGKKGAPAKVDRRTEAPGSGLRAAQKHLLVAK